MSIFNDIWGGITGSSNNPGMKKSLIVTSALAGALANTAGLIGGNLLSGGRDSAVGGIMNQAGSLVSLINPLAGAAVTAAGGMFNRLFGNKYNEENIAEILSNIDRANSYALDSNMGLNELLNEIANSSRLSNFSDSFIGSNGLFNKGASRKANQLREALNAAYNWQSRVQLNAVNNATINQNQLLLASLYGNGGFMNKQIYNSAMSLPYNVYAFGGDLQTNGADFSNGYTFVGKGGTHEQNPNQGVLVGVDYQGTPNMLEEGEVKYGDYVFSDRLKTSKSIRKKYGINTKKDLSYAELSKKLIEESKERPNDPISKAGLESVMQMLIEDLEIKRQEEQAKLAANLFRQLSPEEQAAIMLSYELLNLEQQALQQMQEEASIQELATQQVNSLQENLFAFGGDTYTVDTNSDILPYGTQLDPEKQLKIVDYVMPFVNTIRDNIKTLSSPYLPIRTAFRRHQENVLSTDWDKIKAEAIDNANKTIQAQKVRRDADLRERGFEKAFSNNIYALTAPVAGSAAQVVSDLAGFSNKYKGIQGKLIRKANSVLHPIGSNFNGILRSYNPVDENATIQALDATLAANNRAMINNAGLNRATALSSLAANNYASLNTKGAALTAINEVNDKNRNAAIDANNNILSQKAQLELQAAQANQLQQQLIAQNLINAAAADEAERQYVRATRAANLSNMFNNIGLLGQYLINLNHQREIARLTPGGYRFTDVYDNPYWRVLIPTQATSTTNKNTPN